MDVVCEMRLDAVHRMSEYISAHASLHSTHSHMLICVFQHPMIR